MYLVVGGGEEAAQSSILLAMIASRLTSRRSTGWLDGHRRYQEKDSYLRTLGCLGRSSHTLVRVSWPRSAAWRGSGEQCIDIDTPPIGLRTASL